MAEGLLTGGQARSGGDGLPGLDGGSSSVEAEAGVSMEHAFGWIGFIIGLLSYFVGAGKLKIGAPGS